MTTQIAAEHFVGTVNDLLKEAFESVQGFYLDKGTSLFETLATISAKEASIPVGGKCETLAAQVEHVRFYLEVIARYMTGPPPENVDWGEIWRTVDSVDETEWADSQQRLRDEYERVTDLINSVETWDDDNIGEPIAMIVHTAYHLGEIRQALCILKR